MGSKFSTRKGNRGSSRSIGSGSSRGVSTASHPSMSSQASVGSRGKKSIDRKASVKQKYGFIPDTFSSLEEVTEALRKEGLELCNLIVGIDFTKSNEWTGKVSFNNRSLHAIGDSPNPYEKALSIIGKTLAPLDEDNLIPCFGFGDATTHDQEVFSFHSDHLPCHGFEEVLSCYRKIVPNLRLSGPTSYAPVIEAAIDIVEKSGGQYHVLLIIADGQVTRSVNTSDMELSPQEEHTIKSIGNASSYPLSIVLVGVGDGPWDDMKKFDDKLPARDFDNFQFVNFTEIMNKYTGTTKETAFALAALMEMPLQYKAVLELGILGRATGRAKKIIPRAPPVPYSRPQPAWEPSNHLSTMAHAPSNLQSTMARAPSNLPSSVGDVRDQMNCPICLTNAKDLAFNCGHLTCKECGSKVSNCPICRQPIRSRLRVYTG
ncbi:hypothetical protein FH972_017758 [Carpinus fangiana]|uniref:RING-type domain-containing protein n=1 Tax=Carpinus fangiana TaxID=176857 RepID=A0A5N6RLX5_9ROSI|nr:hypothetical protein FH972_017758 [Carpinus fangiana]